eukprot:CAMPEP_0185805612 /NCGR_PEP_ID=MMETSP1322-20130828/3963_1 /TAXON_ID=265543 /ORGANISM="Minutocellus polymorphus, Strain RCC2270" /LENGTH=472 /DNA_ID=CAMNT_0028501661 /DNA_START=169 /DNA_END=1584 /DNA_ORIENTATION=+
MLASRSPSDQQLAAERDAVASSLTTNGTAGTATASVTFADDSNPTGGGGEGRSDSTRRSYDQYASFASGTSFVLDPNDASADDSNTEAVAGGCAHPIARAKQHFASHQTNNERSVSTTSTGGPAVAATAGNRGNNGPPKNRPPLGTKLLAPLRSHFASHFEDPTATMHHVASSAPPSEETQARLSNLLVSKRSSLRPTELEFLHEICAYGGEEEVKCAIGRLEDEELFFDSKEDEEEEDGSDAEVEEEKDEDEEEEEDDEGEGDVEEEAEGQVNSRQLKEKGSILADDGDNDDGAMSRQKFRAYSEGDQLLASDGGGGDDDDDDEEEKRVVDRASSDTALQQKRRKAKARRMWAKVGSAARIAALANRRAQHRSRSTGSLSEANAASGTTASTADSSAVPLGIVEASPSDALHLSGTTTATISTSTSTSNIATIWRAHETFGLSVTAASSERRIDRKRRSILHLAGVQAVGS